MRLDFDLVLSSTPEGLLARVERSPAGVASQRFAPPFAAAEIADLLSRLAGEEPEGATALAAARGLGEGLFRAVFGGEVGERLEASLEIASGRAANLRLRLRCGEDPELADLPWELLHDPLRGFVALTGETAIVSGPEPPRPLRPAPFTPPLRILAVLASPAGLPGLDLEREWSRLDAALAALRQRGAVVLDRLEEPTLRALHLRLQETGCHVLHFVGHAGFDPASFDLDNRAGVLWLEGEERRRHEGGAPVSGRDLALLLAGRTRLAVLAAGERAAAAPRDPRGAVARDLLLAGVPAAVSLRFGMTGAPAAAFWAELYGALAEEQPLEDAVSRARRACARGEGAGWGAAALHLRGTDGRVLAAPADGTPVRPGRAAAVSPRVSSPAGDPAAPVRRAMAPEKARALLTLALILAALAASAGYRWAVRASRGDPGGPLTSVQAPGLTLGEIAERNRQAKGGQMLLDSVYSLRIVGTLLWSDRQVWFTLEAQRPDRVRVDVNAEGESAAEGFDGTGGWKRDFGAAVARPMTAAELAESRARYGFDELLGNRRWEEAELVGLEEVDGRPCYRLRMSDAEGVATLYVDAETYLETKRLWRPAGSDAEMTTSFLQYQEAGGLMLPFSSRLEVPAPGRRSVVTRILDTVEVNPEIPPERFAPP